MKNSDQFTDNELIDRSLNGDTKALEIIINRYKDMVFNFTLRMLGNYNDAQDISQEVLIKIVTKLSTFPSHNELLEDLSDQIADREIGPDNKVISDEMKNQCVEGMLLCLDREQRSTFIIGAIMGIGSKEGAKALDISEEAFRKRLSRARKDLSQYMNDQCGLVNAENSCRCARKAKAALEAGYMTDDNAVFNKKRLDEVSQFIQFSGNDVDTLLDRVSEVHRQVPVMELGEARIKHVIQSAEFEEFIEFS